MSSQTPRRYWESASIRLAGRINLAAWLDRFAPWAFAVCSFAAGGFYLLRRTQGSPAWVACGLGVGLVAAGVVAWRQACGGFFGKTDARVLIEHGLSMDAGLSAAASGVAAWPAPARRLPRLLRWHAPVTWGWLVAAGALVCAGWWLPTPESDVAGVRPVEKPPALAQTEAWLQELTQLQVADPASVEAMQARARDLAERSPENQYSHSSLEAADALRDQTAAAMHGLADGMDAASAALSPLEKGGGSLTDAQLKGLGERLDAALKGLREGSLTARGDLLKQLSAAQLAGLRSLSPEDAAKLGRQLDGAAKQARGVVGAAGGDVQIAGEGEAAGLLARGPGRGGVSRGPGEAPLTFTENSSDAGSGQTQAVSNDDTKHAALGDLLDTQRGEHEIDPAKAVAVSAAGAVAAPATGGEAVWVDRLTPDERAALKDFFK
ncbi:MAG: hypothetical protein WC661_11085 [Opitutaceae bacterium]|jgi:hypothetical protein